MRLVLSRRMHLALIAKSKRYPMHSLVTMMYCWHIPLLTLLGICLFDVARISPQCKRMMLCSLLVNFHPPYPISVIPKVIFSLSPSLYSIFFFFFLSFSFLFYCFSSFSPSPSPTSFTNFSSASPSPSPSSSFSSFYSSILPSPTLFSSSFSLSFYSSPSSSSSWDKVIAEDGYQWTITSSCEILTWDLRHRDTVITWCIW